MNHKPSQTYWQRIGKTVAKKHFFQKKSFEQAMIFLSSPALFQKKLSSKTSPTQLYSRARKMGLIL